MQLATISRTVTTGKCSVGMLSRSGNTGDPRAGVRPAPLPDDGHPGRRLGACRERAGARRALLDVLVRVVGRAHERPGRDVLEAERVGGRLERRELLRLPVA